MLKKDEKKEDQSMYSKKNEKKIMLKSLFFMFLKKNELE